LFLWLVCCATGLCAIGAESPNRDAFVYILNIGIRDNKIVYNGLRVGFAVGDGRTILTAAHCVEDFENANHSLKPRSSSPTKRTTLPSSDRRGNLIPGSG